MFLLPSPKRWHFRVMPPHPVTFVLDCRLGDSLGTFCFVLSFSCSKLRAFSVWEAERTGPWVEIKLAPFSLCPNLISISAGSLRWQLSCQPGLLRSRASYPGLTNPPATFHYLSALDILPSSHTGGAYQAYGRGNKSLFSKTVHFLSTSESAFWALLSWASRPFEWGPCSCGSAALL